MTFYTDESPKQEVRRSLLPTEILLSEGMEGVERLLEKKPSAVLYRRPDLSSVWKGAGSHVLLDFGREMRGGVRILVCKAKTPARFRITFGESVTEALSRIGEKNAGNDHAARQFEVTLGKMSDTPLGDTGFRFLHLELLEDVEVKIQDVLAESVSAPLPRSGSIETDDPLLDRIVNTAAYTLSLCYQNGFLWDGIKRDRLVWCGDLHPEILTGLYWFGNMPHVRASLALFRDYTPTTEWINNIPSYSAWWIINLAEYLTITGDEGFFEDCRDYAHGILSLMRSAVSDRGELGLPEENKMRYFLDWSTHGHPEAVIGVASLFLLAARRWLELEENADARFLVSALGDWPNRDSIQKPVRAFQILAGRRGEGDAVFLEMGRSRGLSTFMAYYVLTASALRGGKEGLSILKEYYGGMLSRGATTFWEDFDLSWLDGTAPIDRLPKEGERDIHGDFGKHCYTGFRHSLCHGWSSGVLAFLIENLLGIHIGKGGKEVSFHPDAMGLRRLRARLPLGDGWITVQLENGVWTLTLPEGVRRI
ncbi:MAG: alpha-L-rhamnosidase [Clostridia bacterium]|nr:alpha-L-rhamnosidase [Clostridia bacterium]